MKRYFCIFLLLALTLNLNGTNIRWFDHFDAPDIVGAYSLEWNPLGPTVIGYDFSVAFYLKGADESSARNFWISKRTNVLTEIDSIAAVNLVAAEFLSGGDRYGGKSRAAIEVTRRLLSTQVANAGCTGLALLFDNHRDLVSVVSRLKSAGMDETTAKLPLRLGGEAAINENGMTKKWSATWYEIDLLGAIERVTIQGSSDPVRVVSVLREAIFDADTVKPALLRRTNFVDTSLTR